MKRIFYLIIIVLLAFPAKSQQVSDDIGRIIICAHIPDYENLPYESHNLLHTKLMQIITTNGIADNEYIVRFVLTAKINIISKDIVAGPPQRISQKIDITLMVGDIEADKVMSTLTITTVGIGQSDEKSFISAFKNINPNDKRITDFIRDAKEKIISYYSANCYDMIDSARKQYSIQNYERALMVLTSVPDVCSECYRQSSELTERIYVDMINASGSKLLSQAQAIWSKSPDRQGAQEASKLLSKINFAASCHEQARLLMSDITEQMKKIDEREWEFKMKQYDDQVEKEKREWEQSVQEYKDRQARQKEKENREWEQSVQEYKDRQERQKALDAEQAAQRRMIISASRDVAIEYARNQPKTINYNRIYHW